MQRGGGGVTGIEASKKVCTKKFGGLHFCGNVEHVQLKNVTVTQ